ncbi:MAG: 3-deoxy-7-phosphoheptulonate synthase [Myxococcota bacterium]|jgi:3-deoxy-7-phosphoheptulonate synthase|nr:3-deoxy-7-phosphoheptulonate synthase [Myxococcota bacterium]
MFDPAATFPRIARTLPWNGRGHAPCQEIRIGTVGLGGPDPVIIGGPCAVESREQLLALAREVKQAGGQMLRGGAFKPRTSPYSFQGLGLQGLDFLAEARAETGLPIVTEVMDPRLIERVGEVADLLQVGCRSMQNFPLLMELGRQPRPVLLKRGFCSTLEEWLGAAEYIAKGGNDRIVLCERGIRSFTAGEYARNTSDINVVQPVLASTRLPLIFDPSHSTGDAALVPSVARAALAAGVHGLLVEVRTPATPPESLLSDGLQAVTPGTLAEIVRFARWIRDWRESEQ